MKGSTKATDCRLEQIRGDQHGVVRRCKAAQADQIPSRIQSKGRYAESEHRGDEEVSRKLRVVSGKLLTPL